MSRNKMAKDLFLEYKRRTDNAVEHYNRLKETFVLENFPKHAAEIWRLSTLAETWATLATVLSNGEEDYLKQWRTGE